MNILVFHDVLGAGVGIASMSMVKAEQIRPHIRLNSHGQYTASIHQIYRKYIILSAVPVNRNWYYIRFINVNQFFNIN